MARFWQISPSSATRRPSGAEAAGFCARVFLAADDDGFTYRAMLPLESATDPKLALPEGSRAGRRRSARR